MNTNFQLDEFDLAAEREGAALLRHRYATPARPVTRGDCRRKGLTRGCQAAKDRTTRLQTPLAVRASHGLRLGETSYLQPLRAE